MGHVRVGALPQSRKWREVVQLVGMGAGAAQVATATANAAAGALAGAADDRVFVEALWLLVRLPLAARAEDFAEALGECGVRVDGDPSFVEVLAGFADALDAHTADGRGKSDVGEIASAAAAATLTEVVGEASKNRLFTVDADEVREAFASQGTPTKVGNLVKRFLAGFADRLLNSFLSRTLGEQVGPGKPFPSLGDRERFAAGLRTHCLEAAQIVETFANQWFQKHAGHPAGDITRQDVEGFAAHACHKLDGEFRRRGAN